VRCGSEERKREEEILEGVGEIGRYEAPVAKQPTYRRKGGRKQEESALPIEVPGAVEKIAAKCRPLPLLSRDQSVQRKRYRPVPTVDTPPVAAPQRYRARGRRENWVNNSRSSCHTALQPFLRPEQRRQAEWDDSGGEISLSTGQIWPREGAMEWWRTAKFGSTEAA
jgi:hypothetical protein